MLGHIQNQHISCRKTHTNPAVGQLDLRDAFLKVLSRRLYEDEAFESPSVQVTTWAHSLGKYLDGQT